MTSSYRKYGNRKVWLDNILFQSVHEADRYKELIMLQSAGLITELELQPRFKIVIEGQKICTYIADFRYLSTETGQRITEDAKGYPTPEYKIKKKLVRALYGIEVIEV